MKHRILIIAITIFFGIATYIMIKKVSSEKAQNGKEAVDHIGHSPVNKFLNRVGPKQKNR